MQQREQFKLTKRCSPVSRAELGGRAMLYDTLHTVASTESAASTSHAPCLLPSVADADNCALSPSSTGQRLLSIIASCDQYQSPPNHARTTVHRSTTTTPQPNDLHSNHPAHTTQPPTTRSPSHPQPSKHDAHTTSITTLTPLHHASHSSTSPPHSSSPPSSLSSTHTTSSPNSPTSLVLSHHSTRPRSVTILSHSLLSNPHGSPNSTLPTSNSSLPATRSGSTPTTTTPHTPATAARAAVMTSSATSSSHYSLSPTHSTQCAVSAYHYHPSTSSPVHT